jgi:hypothetical protein
MFTGNFRVRYLKTTKQITLLRNILASIVYEPSGLKFSDCLVLYDLLPQMLEKSDKDQQFNKKYGSKLIIAYELIKEKLNPTIFPYKPKKDVVTEIKDKLYGFIPSESAYFGWSRNPLREQSYEVIPVSLKLRLPKRKVNKSYIGVGYRDKGYLKNPSKDGSPGWKTVGRNVANLERIVEEDPDEAQEIVARIKPGRAKTLAQQVLDKVNN